MTLRDDLHHWLAEQPLWQQDLARRLVSRTQLDDEERDDALHLIRGAFSALGDDEPASLPQAIELNDLPSGTSAGEIPCLLGFGCMRGVGMVAADQKLKFEPHGLTVIYGPNSAGKTTYVRGLKRVCRTVDCDTEVRGNIFGRTEPGDPPPSAKVELLLGEERRTQELDLADPADLGLQAISVFDARCAELYVDEKNAVAYVPSVLMLLTRLAATQDRMRRDITQQIEELERERPAFAELGASTEATRRVGALVAATDLKELRRFATLDETEHARLTALRALIAATEAKTAVTEAQTAERDASQAGALAQKLRDLESRVAEPAVQTLQARATDAAQAKAAVALAATEFAQLPVPGVGGEPWERLWRAAREFSAQHDAVFPPGEHDSCPLCLQEISTDVAARMAHFEAHVQSTINQQATAADRALTDTLETIDEQHVTASRTEFLTGIKDREEALYRAVESYLSAISRRMNDLRNDPPTATAMPILDDPAEQLETWAQTRTAHAQALRAAEDPKREQALRSELAELDARDKLFLRLDDIATWVAVLQRITALKNVHNELATNRVTTQQRILSETLVTDTLAGKLNDEVRNLRCDHLPINLQPHTAIGNTQVALRLTGAHDAPQLSEILSEGERRALSLAFFLAEVRMFEGSGGIIVDDPVSSLDDERRAYIADRLVAEAQRRQVIVFTHDIAFMFDLADQAKAKDIEPLVQGVWRTGSEVGRVDDHPPFATLKLSARIGVLNQRVEQWDKQETPANFDEAWHRVCDFYAQLRITWERAIEERLFRGVVQRFQRQVKTLALKDVDVTPERIQAITDGMTRCSCFVHDSPPGTQTTLPARKVLAEDLAELQAFEKQTRSTK